MRGRVLIVDDDPDISAGMSLLLEDEGLDVQTTSSPFEFPILLRRLDPDLVLMDLQMPALSGESVLDIVTQRDLKGDARFVLFSGRDTLELAQLTERLGADGFLQKGADVDQMLRRIRIWVAQRQLIRQRRESAA
jgi:two-component system OmpR family response regulator